LIESKASISKHESPIYVLGKNSVVRFSAEELSHYLEKMTGVKYSVNVVGSLSLEKGICLGTVEDFEGFGFSLCEKSELDDIIILKTVGKTQFVSGSNPRSVLFATYRYLEFLGAEWLWPGEDGEVLPEIEEAKTGFNLKERASYQHRGVCIEGAVSPEIVIDFIDWMTKRRMNEFFLQFKTSQNFYNLFYTRKYNPFAKSSPTISAEESLNADARIIEEIKKRGIIVERVGHGWTCEAIGIRGLGWDVETQPISEKQRHAIALIDGKRELFRGIAVNTELCYSNPEIFNILVNHVVQYAIDHPEVSILHFWLSDGINNHCECLDCQKLSPSDWYSKLVSTISQKLGGLSCKTRIVFLCYANTLWAPTKEKIKDNYRNIIFMFAPISRCYIHHLADDNCAGSISLQPPPRNKIVPPRTNYEFVQLLKGWQKCCQSDSFLFDYHLLKGFMRPLLLIGDIGKVLWRDLHDLKYLGLNGVLSCQTLRAFYPTGIPMVILGETAWNNRVNLEEITNRYLRASFGEDAPFVSDYLKEIYSFVNPAENYEHYNIILAAERDKLQETLKFVKESRMRLRKIAEKQRAIARKKSAYYLLHHNKYLTLILEAAILYSKGDKEKAVALVDESQRHFLATEDEILKVADVSIISRSLEQIKANMRQ